MKDESKTKQELLKENAFLKQKIQGLEQLESERKRADENLITESSLREALLDNIPNCIALILKKDTREIVASNKYAREIGELLGQKCFKIFAVRDDTCPFCLAPELWKTGQSQNLEVEYSGKWYEGIWAPLSEDLYVHYIFDITERKREEEALRLDSEIMANIADGVQLAKVSDRTIIYTNQQFDKMFGYSSRELVGRNVSVLNAPTDKVPDETANEILQSIKKNGTWNGEILNIRKDGKAFWCFASVTTFTHSNFGPVWVSVHQNITERKQAEEKIKASLREKDLLLSEIHHRVKNNLQVISGLLELQTRSSKNLEVIKNCNESQNRIRSMAMIHEKLYDSKDFAKIELSGYMRSLFQELLQSHNINYGKIDLTIQTDGEVYLAINKAIPCGLIMNELISNALKHAFPGDGQGKIEINIGETRNSEIEIVVRDNGVGLPDDIDISETKTVGLYLVNGLAKDQLDGQIAVRKDNGTEIRITFPL